MTEDVVTVVPANEAPFDDLQTIFGTRGDPIRCQCQWYKTPSSQWRATGPAERKQRLREQTGCGDPQVSSTTGLIAYLGSEPVGWCAVEPRVAYPHLLTKRVPWTGRSEDQEDDTVWAVTCFVIRLGYRRRGLTTVLAAATVEFAKNRGAKALEAYPMITWPGKEITWGELHVGSRNVFADVGFTEVSHPTPRRVVMRIDF